MNNWSVETDDSTIYSSLVLVEAGMVKRRETLIDVYREMSIQARCSSYWAKHYNYIDVRPAKCLYTVVMHELKCEHTI